jgi:hypothetical protein
MKTFNPTRFLTPAAILMTTNVAFASTVNLGTLTPFTGGDAGEGIDLSGNIIYAFNLGGTSQTVQGVEFAAASVFAPPADITTPVETLEFDYSIANPGGANGTDYGLTSDDDALETIVNSVWYNTNWTFDLAVTPGTQYQLQLVLQESFITHQGTDSRNFSVSVETAAPETLSLAIDELVLGQETNGAFVDGTDAGLVYTYTFTASDSSFRVALADSLTGIDTFAVLAAMTLEELGADTIAPGLSTLDPVDDATAVPVISDLVVTFDEIVVFGTGNITIKESVGGAVVETFNVTTSPNLLLDGTSVTINPTGDLAGTTDYYVEIDPEAIDDPAANSFAGITGGGIWNFTTASTDVTAPTVGTVDNPVNGANDVSVDSGLGLTFDEEVQKAAGNIVIRRSDDNTVVDTIDVTTASVTVTDMQVAIIPNVVFPSLTGLYVEIEAGAFEDLAGNPFMGISGPASWAFTTVEFVPPPVTPFTGGDAGEGLDLSGNVVYAFNLGGPNQTVQGVEFTAASVFAPPAGITTPAETLEFDYATANPGGANGADYGDSADDDSLETIVNSVWYNSNWTFDLEVVPGRDYQLQLIFQESFFPFQGLPGRNFDVSVGTAAEPLTLALDDFAQGLETNGANQAEEDFGVIYTHTFTAADSSFRVALDDNPLEIGDGNAVLAAVVLQEISGGGLTITGIDYDADAGTVTLTWRKIGTATYLAKISTDMIDWETDLDDNITAMSDENPDDAEHLTVTFPLPPEFQNEERLFFRIEL